MPSAANSWMWCSIASALRPVQPAMTNWVGTTVKVAGAETPAALSAELTRMARWLGLERVEVVGKGDLAARLQAAVQTPASG